MTLKSTENDAIIKIKNIQSADGEEQTTELICEGKFYESGEKLYIFYKEDDAEDSGVSSIMIIISGTEVTLNRKGEFGSKMHYIEGKTKQVIYKTPYGDMVFLLKTLKIENNLEMNGGTLRLLYKLIINGEEMNNDLLITVSKNQKKG